MCYISDDTTNLEKYGKVDDDKCHCGRGERNLLSVFKIDTWEDPAFDHLGCFNDWDSDSRSFKKYLDYDGWGMTPTKCYELILKNGGPEKYPIFGVQKGAECWAGTPEEAAAEKFKNVDDDTKKACVRKNDKGSVLSVGMGKDWHNDVYRIRIKP